MAVVVSFEFTIKYIRQNNRQMYIICIYIYEGKGKDHPITDSKTQRRGRVIALHLGAGRGWVVSTTPRPLYPRERPGTHCTGGWVGPRAGLDVFEKSLPYRDSIPGPSSPQPVTILTELSRPPYLYIYNVQFSCCII
jgi:hypothetical protein